MTRARSIVLAVGLVTLGSGCTGASVPETRSASTSGVASDGESAGGGERLTAGEYVIGCDRFTIGEDFGPLATAYGVEEGDLTAQPCFGSAEPIVERAFGELRAITPASLLAAVTLIAGYEANGSDTIAYAGPVDDDTEGFLIALDIGAGEEDPGELRLTMIHELAHVFTQTTDQLDIAVFADECDTLFNGFGCFQPDAYITAWIDAFWDPADLAALPPSGDVDEPAGEARCAIDPAFPGSYAASHPEEDFAESLAAYVLDLEMPPDVQPRLAFFDAYDEFVEMRSRVADAGLGGVANNFDQCG